MNEFIEIIGKIVVPIVVAVIGGVFGAKRFMKKRTPINKSKGNFISDGNKNNGGNHTNKIKYISFVTIFSPSLAFLALFSSCTCMYKGVQLMDPTMILTMMTFFDVILFF